MANELSTPYSISDEQIATYQKNGYIKLKNVLSAETLTHYGAEISRVVQEKSRDALPIEERDTYSKAFLACACITIRRFLKRQAVALRHGTRINITGRWATTTPLPRGSRCRRRRWRWVRFRFALAASTFCRTAMWRLAMKVSRS